MDKEKIARVIVADLSGQTLEGINKLRWGECNAYVKLPYWERGTNVADQIQSLLEPQGDVDLRATIRGIFLEWEAQYGNKDVKNMAPMLNQLVALTKSRNICPECDGMKTVPIGKGRYRDELGIKPCPKCRGTGKVEPQNICSKCHGSGQKKLKLYGEPFVDYENCPKCKGTGRRSNDG